MFVYLTDGTRKSLDKVLWRFEWGGRDQQFRLGDILPTGMHIVIENSANEARAWALYSAYLRLPSQTVTFAPDQQSCDEHEFRRFCVDSIANYCDDIDSRVVTVNGRVKRPMHAFHSRVIRTTRVYRERMFMFIDAAERLATARNIDLTLE
jgi:hypothetical protein